MTGSGTATAAVREAHRRSGRRIAVLDDDPTGSQTVHDVSVVLDLDPVTCARALAGPGATCFILTNSRSLPATEAFRIAYRAGRDLFALGQRLGVPVTVVSRSDSTLRGHLAAEVTALDAARRRVTGRGHDGVLFVPAYLEAGRFTTGATHRARLGDRVVPVAETEFARDPAFGYSSSDLREHLAERYRGRVRAADVVALTLDDIRGGGPARVAEVLGDVRGGRFVVVDAAEHADLDTVALGVAEVEAAGHAFLHRTGPSFVRALAGIDPAPPLPAHRLRPSGGPAGPGLVVVGSHVGLTNRQLAVLRERYRAGGVPLADLELPVAEAVDAARRPGLVRELAERVRDALARSDVLLVTSRELRTGADPADPRSGLEVARTVSACLADVVRRALPARPAWVVAKGGITAHDVAARGLGMRRGTVLGQLLPGLVSVFRPDDAAPGAVGVPYVVFAGNVGDEQALADVVERMAGRPPGPRP